MDLKLKNIVLIKRIRFSLRMAFCALSVVLIQSCHVDSDIPFQVNTEAGYYSIGSEFRFYVSIDQFNPLHGAVAFHRGDSAIFINSSGDNDIILVFRNERNGWGSLSLQIKNFGKFQTEISSIEYFRSEAGDVETEFLQDVHLLSSSTGLLHGKQQIVAWDSCQNWIGKKLIEDGNVIFAIDLPDNKLILNPDDHYYFPKLFISHPPDSGANLHKDLSFIPTN